MTSVREYDDTLGQRWQIGMEPSEDPTDVVDEEVVLHFTPVGGKQDDREILARGPLQERFEELGEEDLELALEAAGNDLGFLFLPREGRLWWVRKGDEDPVADGARISFSTLTDEHHYGGPHGGRLETLSEDELEEILDEARGLVRP